MMHLSGLEDLIVDKSRFAFLNVGERCNLSGECSERSESARCTHTVDHSLSTPLSSLSPHSLALRTYVCVIYFVSIITGLLTYFLRMFMIR